MATHNLILVMVVTVTVLLLKANVIDAAYNPCVGTCDIQVENFSSTLRVIEAGTEALISFTVTFLNANAALEVLEVTGDNKYNFDCTMKFSESNIGVGAPPADPDVFDTAPVVLVQLTNPKQCTILNSKDLQTGLLPVSSKPIYGECKITLPAEKCAKAVWLCVDCPRPDTATYTTDAKTQNNKKCILIKSKVYCEKGRKCYQGTGDNKLNLRCSNSTASCVRTNFPEARAEYFCQSDKYYCKDKGNSLKCKQCYEDGCNKSSGTNVRASIMVVLVTILAAITYL